MQHNLQSENDPLRYTEIIVNTIKTIPGIADAVCSFKENGIPSSKTSDSASTFEIQKDPNTNNLNNQRLTSNTDWIRIELR